MGLIKFLMSFITPFFLPVVHPPDKDFSNTLAYYDDLKTQGVKIVAASPSPGSPLEITIEKADVVHAEPHEDDPMSTVYAMTSGFVSYQLGDLVLRVWTGDYNTLDKIENGPPRANRIVLGSLDPGSVETAIKKQIETLSDAVLEESWKQTGSGVVPGRAPLETEFLARFMSGEAEVFVDAGTVLGTASITPETTNAPVARMTLEAFFDPAGPAPPIAVAPEDLIDNALRPRYLPKFTNHPLLRAISGPVQIHFLSRFLIWDNTPGVRDYIPLANGQVTLLAGPDLTNLPDVDVTTDIEVVTATTNGNGFIDLIAPPLPSRSLIHFRYATIGKTFGLRAYTEDVETNAHKARLHLNGNFENAKDYRAKFEVYPKYRDFANDLANHEDNEKYGLDRGTMSVVYDKIFQPLGIPVLKGIVPPITHRDLMKHIAAFEASYKADVLPATNKTLNILVEGDSWLNYPFAFNDIYGHLDQILWANTKPDVTYNRAPLQHYGDRTDQMFFASSPTADRQWRITREFLSEYKIDLIFASGGGNDMAESGISNDDESILRTYFSEGYFDPFLAKAALEPMLGTAERLMRQSFAVLLNNHRWHFYFDQSVPLKDEAAMSAMLQPLLAQLGKDFGPDDLMQQANSLQEIGEKVIANFPDTFSPGSPEDLLIQAVFDPIGFGQRYIDMKNNWKILLDEAAQRQIPVISHTYGYPLFNEEPTSITGSGKKAEAGPWFTLRFNEAKIIDRRIQKICLKVILDKFVTDVLNPLKAEYPLFDYADIRNLNSSSETWRDEMHLRSSGYRKIADKIYLVIAGTPTLSQFFL
jgi:lysophospholipase L1-like esterase